MRLFIKNKKTVKVIILNYFSLVVSKGLRLWKQNNSHRIIGKMADWQLTRFIKCIKE